MYRLTRLASITLINIAIGLSGCGGDSGGGSAQSTIPTTPPPVTSTVSGSVSAPSETVVQFEQQNVLRMLASLVISDLQAAVTGLTSVTNATVELIRIDKSGAQVGGVIASTTTDSVTGTYSLEFEGTLSSDLVVQVTGTSGIPMRALAVAETTDINPVTEYVMQQILASIATNDNISLSAVTAKTVTDLTGFVEELDITFSSSDTITDTTAAIDTVADANSIDAEISASLNGSLIGPWGWDFENNGEPGSGVVITFLEDSTFMLIHDNINPADTTGMAGIESGTYTWDAATGAISFSVDVDTNGEWGVSHSTFTGAKIDGNTLTLITDEGEDTAVRIASGDNPEVGAWMPSAMSGDLALLVFLEDGTFAQGQDGTSDTCGMAGMERGVYSRNTTAGTVTLTVDIDTNGCIGIKDESATNTAGVTLFGDNFILSVTNDGNTSLHRITASPRSPLVDCNTVGAPYSHDAFLAVIASCGTQPIIESDIVGNTIVFDADLGEQMVFNGDGTGQFTNDGGASLIDFTWSITAEGYLNISYDVNGDGATDLIDQIVAYSGDLTNGLMIKGYTDGDETNGDMVFDSIADGEIWDDTFYLATTGSKYQINLTGKIATSVMTSSACSNGVTGGWTYVFNDNGFVLKGADNFQSDGLGNCTIGGTETHILTQTDIQSGDGDIPFNCGNDNICTFGDLNKEISGTDEDGRSFVSTYTHVADSNIVTYTKVATNSDLSETTYTEVITIADLTENPFPCNFTGSPVNYNDFTLIAQNCGPQPITEADLAGKTIAYQAAAGEQFTFNNDGTGSYNNGSGEQYTISWSIDANSYLNISYDFGYSVKEQFVAYQGNLTNGLSIKVYGEGETIAGITGDLIFDHVSDGEIYDDVLVEVISAQ